MFLIIIQLLSLDLLAEPHRRTLATALLLAAPDRNLS
jgi:hypothetical protein